MTTKTKATKTKTTKTKMKRGDEDRIDSLHRAKLGAAHVEQLLAAGQDRVRANDHEGALAIFDEARIRARQVDEYVDRMTRSFAIAGALKLSDLCPACGRAFESKTCGAEHSDVHAAIEQRGSVA